MLLTFACSLTNQLLMVEILRVKIGTVAIHRVSIQLWRQCVQLSVSCTVCRYDKTNAIRAICPVEIRFHSRVNRYVSFHENIAKRFIILVIFQMGF